jgi:hypothetical protein
MSRRTSALALFVVLTLVHTWPLVTAPARLSRNDNADTMLNEWTIAWVAHQLPRDPLHLFEANTFYPNHNTLAYSEHLFVPAVAGAPLFWLGASPVLVYNLLLLTGFVLTGWAGWYVVSKWTGDWWAGALSGSILAFNAHTMTRLPHLQAMHGEFLALALLALDDLLQAPRVRHALRLALWFTLQSLTSFYTLVFSIIALSAGALVRPAEWMGRHFRRVAPLLLLSSVVAVVVVVPFLLPYQQLGERRPLAEVALMSASWRDYLTTPARAHYEMWSRRWFSGNGLFPGSIGLTLTAAAIVTGVAFRDRRARMALAFGLAGLALSFGPALPGYSTLYRVFPLLAGIRAAGRFGYLVIVAVAVLSGFALASARDRWSGRRWLMPVTIAIVTLANVDALVAPIGFVSAEPIPTIYDRLARIDHAVIVEIPFPPPDRFARNAPFMLASTRHWHPMLNGFSGLLTNSYDAQFAALQNFPDGVSIRALREQHVTHVVVHTTLLEAAGGRAAVGAVLLSPDLQLVAQKGDVSLYRLKTADGSS